ncbi:MAG TPA: GntR family transcriptional regulator [Mobilitalea sp.]|nr:GntR family transcriptional regulator [Mobilitalea sp.]
MEFINNVPIYVQVIDDIKRDIVNGILPMGGKMPSSRELALKYKINPNTSSRIYREMEAEGICFTKRGLGTFVTEDKETVVRIREKMAEDFINSFIQGMKGLGFTREELNHLISIKYGEGGA